MAAPVTLTKTAQSQGKNTHSLRLNTRFYRRAVSRNSIHLKGRWSPRCWLVSVSMLRTGLWISVVTILLFKIASAETLVHLSHPVWGCVDPNEAARINDNTNPARSDPQWVARTAAVGQCIMLGPIGQWATLSENYNGLTYVRHLGGVAPIGLFWVPTAALVIDAKQSMPAVAASLLPVRPRSVKPPIAVAKPSTETALPTPQPASPASSPVAVSAKPVPTSSTAPVSSPQQSGGIITIWVILGALLVFGLFGSSMRHKKSVQRKSAKAKPPVKPTMDADFRIHPSSNAPPNSRSTWHPPGTSVSIAGITVTDGMIYIGKTSGSHNQYDGCVIDPSLPLGIAAAAEPLGYWPSYQNISPNCRKRYLEWLGNGKLAADIDIGYVFLYFYGIERRLILDAPTETELESLSQELRRLRSLYSSNGSFNGYSARLLDAAAFLRAAGARSGNAFTPDLAAPGGEMPPALKLAIAREVVSGQPLRFDLAAAAIIGMRDFWASHRRVLDHARQPFLQVLQSRFAATFPSGLIVRNRKDSKLTVSYRGATAGLYADLAVRAGLKGLPDPDTLTWTKLLILAEAVASELAPLAKLLAYYPIKAKSLAALVSCPVELRDSIAVDGRRWVEGLASPAPVPFGLLAKHAIGAEGTKWTVHHRRRISDALAAVGWSMTPGPEAGIERLTDNTIVYVTCGVNNGYSREMVLASAAAMLVAKIARLNKEYTSKIEEFWLSRLRSRLTLPASEIDRLRALLAWYRTSNAAIPRIKPFLGKATSDEYEFCAWSATVAIGATGNVDKPQIAALEAIYDDFGVARGALYTELHAGMAAAISGADEPVAVSDEVAEVVHPIPLPPAAKTLGPDVNRLTKIRAETESVSAMLASIFTEAESESEQALPASDIQLLDLDNEHAALLTKLVTKSEWARHEFEAIVASLSLMPDGALEAINEWAFDRYGEALIEDGNPLVLNLDLLAEELSVITSGL